MTRGKKSLMTTGDRAGATDLLNPTIQRLTDPGTEINVSGVPEYFRGLYLGEDRTKKGYVWNGCGNGVWLHSAPVSAELSIPGSSDGLIFEAGAVWISCDQRSDEDNFYNGFSLLPGTSRRVPFDGKIVIRHPRQVNKQLYLEVSADVPLGEQIFTPKVEVDTGRSEVVRFGDPNDSDAFNVITTGLESAILGFQEDRVKKELLGRLKSASFSTAGIKTVRDTAGTVVQFTQEQNTYYYRMSGAAANQDLRDRIPEGEGTPIFAKYRFTLIDVGAPAPNGHVHILSAEIYNKWGVYECTPIVNPDVTQTNAGAVETAVEASRFESPWILFYTGAGQGDFTLQMTGNSQFTDRSPGTLGAGLMVDVDYLGV